MMEPQNKKIKIGILFGGRSAEHEVSLQSAKNVCDALDRNKYDVVLIGIDKSGQWFLQNTPQIGGEGGNSVAAQTSALRVGGDAVALAPASCGQIANFAAPSLKCVVDIVFPILHGPFGEDGTVQGLLKLADIPFVGSGVLGSAVGMDKDVMKRLLQAANIPIGKYIVLQSHEQTPPYDNIVKVIGEPFFVKPANMGSSVGVEKIHNETEYKKFTALAFDYDTKIIFEEFIQGREIECSVLGNETPCASLPGEIKSSHEFYSYEAKYLDEKGAVLEIPAKLPSETVQKIQNLALQTFKTLCAEGLSRIDFFLKADGSVFVNEINTMPGFTKISMYPKLWEASGISYSNLIDKLITLAIARHEKEKKLKTSYIDR
jgi:D-alanine-D-alanine ligase